MQLNAWGWAALALVCVLVVLGFVSTGLRVAHIIAWPWFWVFAPWCLLAALVCIAIILFVLICWAVARADR